MTVIRHNILKDDNSRDSFIRGVKLLKNDYLNPDWFNTYDIFVIWHFLAMMEHTPSTQPRNEGPPRNAAHSGPAFLPWHRLFLILLERHLQRVLDDATFGLPYWDWAEDGELPEDQQKDSPFWSNACMGGNGDPIQTGPFSAAEWTINIDSRLIPNTVNPELFWNNRSLRRNFPNPLTDFRPRRGLPTKAEVRDIVNSNTNAIYDSPDWKYSEGFRNSLEGWSESSTLHNLVHVWVGGDMGPATSPNDPVFYMNHCNVDRIWAGWQTIRGNPPYVPDDTESDLLFRHRLNDRLYEITTSPIFDPIYQGNVRPSDLLDVSNLYVYDTIDDMR